MSPTHITKTKITLVGHPFAPIGMGEHLRSAYRAFRATGIDARLLDVYGARAGDPEIREELEGALIQELSPELNLFCLNGDEVEPALHKIGGLRGGAYNIVYPAWELGHYPAEWAEQLNKFDEIWSTSAYTQRSIRAAVRKPVMQMPLPGEVHLSTFLGRKHFDIPESPYVFLFFFDFTSYIERKNPFAVLQAFDELCRRRPSDDLYMVVKVKGGEHRAKEYERFREYVTRYKNNLMVMDKVLSDNEIKNLMRCSDCFLSLHRAEGYGLGLIQAMFLGKPVVATAYSGNLDFMNEQNSCLVRCDLCDVAEGAYPFAEGQVWAEPDITQAVDYMLQLVLDPDHGTRIGERASRDIRVKFSYQAIGLRYLERIKEILSLRRLDA